MMERMAPGRGRKFLYMAVSVFFLGLTVWLYLEEGPYVKKMDLYVKPDKGRFQVEILADGKHVQAGSLDEGVLLFAAQSMVEGKTRLLVDGECQSDKEMDSVHIRVVSDSEDVNEEWKYQAITGTDVKPPVLTGTRNYGRNLYLSLAVLAGTFVGARVFCQRNSAQQKELEAYGSRIIEMLEQEPGMAQSCEDGKRLFIVYERRKGVNLLLTVWLCVFVCSRLFHQVWHGAGMRTVAVWYGLLLFSGVLSVGVSSWYGVSFRRFLTKDCRPVTAAAAYLWSAGCGMWWGWGQFVMYHNAAAGLYRSGHSKEALEVCELAWKLLKKKPKEYIAYTHSSLRYQCLQVLGRLEEAQKEKIRMEALLEGHPFWRKRKDITRVLGLQSIHEWIKTGEIEQAETSAYGILGQWKEGYYRLPVLGLMVELKEFLGKEEEAGILRNEILTFSPENKEVRQAMAEGRLSFRWEKVQAHDWVGSGLRMLCVIGIVVSFLMTAMGDVKQTPFFGGTIEQETGMAVEPSVEGEANP